MCVCVCVVIAADATAKRNEHAHNNTRNTATATRQQQLLEQHETYEYSASTIIISAAQTQLRPKLSSVPSSPLPSPLVSTACAAPSILIKRTCHRTGHVISWRTRLLLYPHQRISQSGVWSHLGARLPRRHLLPPVAAACCR